MVSPKANSTKEEPPQTAASRFRESCGRTHKTFVVDYFFQGDGEKMKEKSCSTAEMQSGKLSILGVHVQ